MKVKNTYLVVVTIIGLISLAMYTTYAMFTASLDIGGFVDLTASNLPADTSVIEYERLSLTPGESKIIDLNIKNTTDGSLYYGVWYEMIEPSSINNDIVIGKLDTSLSETIGQLDTNVTNKVTLLIENNSNGNLVINLGVGYSETSSLNLPTYMNLVTEEVSEGIDMNDVVIPEPVDFNYSGGVQNYSVSTAGKYKLEVWGAQGGGYSSNSGGLGGHSYGIINLNKDDKLYVYVGGFPGIATTAGYNGGSATSNYGGGGGGASDIRIDVNNDGAGTLYERVIVAGGGGGAGYSSATGGAGGGINGLAGSGTGTYAHGGGGSQTAGGTGYATANVGNFGTGGGSSSIAGGGGGGGWYGGGHGQGGSKDSAGGGGSGFVLTTSTASNVPSGYLITNTSYYLTDAATVAGDTSFTSPTGSSETGHSGNGYARITPISTVPSLSGIEQLTIKPGTTYDLLSDVTCIDNGAGCTLVKVSISDTSTLAEGTYEVIYIVKDNNNVKYKYTRVLLVTNNLDESGANTPDLIEGLIPVMYDGTQWVKADSTNSNEEYQWYDYTNKKWANAVLVSGTNRQTYIDADVGITISEDDVLAYYVWIPRYRYKVWNINKVIGTDSYSARTTGIDIIFESEVATTGTIKCTSYSFASPSSSANSPNEKCSGSNGEYYTHPAFWWDNDGDGTREENEELRGIWIGKSEVTGSSSQITTKPKTDVWTRSSPTIYSEAIQAMGTSAIYGLNSENTASHMIKNMEWGAVAYLTNSEYGKCSNSSCTEVSINEYIMSTGSDYVLHPEHSTTGNIYGIYSMNGGAGEYVMGNMSYVSGSYTYYSELSVGGEFTYDATTAKYMDTYANGVSADTQQGYNRSRLGDATGEIVLSSSTTGGWYSDTSRFVIKSSPWFQRGGYRNNSSSAGLFSFSYASGASNDTGSARAALIAIP